MRHVTAGREWGMSRDSGLSRRGFIGAAGATAVGALAPGVSLAHGGRDGDGGHGGDGHHGRGSRLVPRDRLGLQQWSIRDAITRLDGSVSGYLGGRNFPEDPTDLGPLVPLPGGFRSVFRYLASVGYRGIEFFSFDQGPNGPITDDAAGDATIRRWLDRSRLVAAGSHTGGLQQMLDAT